MPRLQHTYHGLWRGGHLVNGKIVNRHRLLYGGRVTEVEVAGGNSFFIDTSSLSMIQGISWHKGGNYIWTRRTSDPRLRLWRCKNVSLHRFLKQYNGPLDVDHADRNPMNNVSRNLRLVSKRKNGHNCALRSHNRSGINGLSLRNERYRWCVTWRENGSTKHKYWNRDPAIESPTDEIESFIAQKRERGIIGRLIPKKMYDPKKWIFSWRNSEGRSKFKLFPHTDVGLSQAKAFKDHIDAENGNTNGQ